MRFWVKAPLVVGGIAIAFVAWWLFALNLLMGVVASFLPGFLFALGIMAFCLLGLGVAMLAPQVPAAARALLGLALGLFGLYMRYWSWAYWGTWRIENETSTNAGAIATFSGYDGASWPSVDGLWSLLGEAAANADAGWLGLVAWAPEAGFTWVVFSIDAFVLVVGTAALASLDPEERENALSDVLPRN